MKIEAETNWPSYFPQNCPPFYARAESREVYRLVKQNPPSNGDFKCHKLIYKNTFFGAKECQACGLSVYGTLDGAREAQAALPALKKKYPLIARGRVTSESGKILETPSDQSKTHITWWVYANIKAHTMFTVIG